MNRHAQHDIVIRHAGAGDAAALARLAALDGAPFPQGPHLLAEVNGELWAALPLAGGRAIADPFRPSAAAGELLAAWAGDRTGEDRAARRAGLLGALRLPAGGHHAHARA